MRQTWAWSRWSARRVRLDEVNAAFEAMGRQDGIRTVITY